MPAGAAAPMGPDDWGQLLKDLDAGFSETLLQLIDRTGKTLKLKKAGNAIDSHSCSLAKARDVL